MKRKKKLHQKATKKSLKAPKTSKATGTEAQYGTAGMRASSGNTVYANER